MTPLKHNQNVRVILHFILQMFYSSISFLDSRRTARFTLSDVIIGALSSSDFLDASGDLKEAGLTDLSQMDLGPDMLYLPAIDGTNANSNTIGSSRNTTR